MDESVAGFTVRVVDPDTVPDVTVIVVVPAATEVAKPPALIVATPVLDEAQVDVNVRSCVVLSENVPVATNCTVVPLAMLGFIGVIAMDTRLEQLTVTVVEPDVVPDVAEIVVLPQLLPYAYACPLLVPDARSESADKAAVLTVTTDGSDEVQVAVLVRSCFVLSVYIPVAVRDRVVFFAIAGLVGAISIAAS